MASGPYRKTHLSLRSFVSGQAQHGLTSSHDLEVDWLGEGCLDGQCPELEVSYEMDQESTNNSKQKLRKLNTFQTSGLIFRRTLI